MATASAARSAPATTGARVALPIFEPIIEAIWAEHIAPKAPLSGPSPEAQRDLVDMPIDYMTGDRVSGGKGFIEHFRRRADGHVDDTQYQMVSREERLCLARPGRRPINEQGLLFGAASTG